LPTAGFSLPISRAGGGTNFGFAVFLVLALVGFVTGSCSVTTGVFTFFLDRVVRACGVWTMLAPLFFSEHEMYKTKIKQNLTTSVKKI